MFRLIIGQISVVCVCVCDFSSFAIDSRSFFCLAVAVVVVSLNLFRLLIVPDTFVSFGTYLQQLSTRRCHWRLRHFFAPALQYSFPLPTPSHALSLLFYIYNFFLFPFMLVFGLKKQQQNVKKQTEKNAFTFSKELMTKSYAGVYSCCCCCCCRNDVIYLPRLLHAWHAFTSLFSPSPFCHRPVNPFAAYIRRKIKRKANKNQ